RDRVDLDRRIEVPRPHQVPVPGPERLLAEVDLAVRLDLESTVRGRLLQRAAQGQAAGHVEVGEVVVDGDRVVDDDPEVEAARAQDGRLHRLGNRGLQARLERQVEIEDAGQNRDRAAEREGAARTGEREVGVEARPQAGRVTQRDLLPGDAEVRVGDLRPAQR